MWGAGVELARSGAVAGVSDDGEEVELRVKSRARPVPNEVFLWPEDGEWGCDCGRGVVCVHVVAAAIAVSRGQRTEGRTLPTPAPVYQVRVRYVFQTRGQALAVRRELLYKDGTSVALQGALARQDVMATRVDAQAERLLAMHPAGPLGAGVLRSLLIILEGKPPATLDDAVIQLSAEPVRFRIKISDDGEGFQIGLFRPSGIDALFRGAALVGDVLHPTSHGDLAPDQRRTLVQGVRYGPQDAGVLVSEVLPRLRSQAPVDVETERLPRADQLVPRVALTFEERARGLLVSASLIYGDPPVARVTDKGGLERLVEGLVPARDKAAERAAVRAWELRTGFTAPFRRIFPPAEAAAFLEQKLPRHKGPVYGRPDRSRYRIADTPLLPHIRVDGAQGQDWQLGVRFAADGAQADPTAVLDAWRSGASLVPLLDGGWAPLPMDWLQRHGALLRELLEARDAAGRVQRAATAALVELLEDTDAEVPPDLRRLRAFLEGTDELPEVAVPAGVRAELRPYQHVGFAWLRFLRDMDLHGVLADDMGLGKTVQALAAMADVPGPHLVVAPTSVLRNWAIESGRFTPDLTVNVYHGASRKLDDHSDLTLTSYALLRIDLEALGAREWSYVVLDESQAIKNPSSQTARAACKLRAGHRLALTGTPVENRLEELWSQFRFLMPGLLGSLETFRERFSRPIEVGDKRAAQALRARVRPYVLRRLKRQVAAELPPLTEIVVRCTLPPAQRRVYNGVRLMGRRDVQNALTKGMGGGGALAVLEALLRMRQACCDPTLLPGDAGEGVGSAKLDRLEELLVELVCDDHKALVFSQWTSLLDRAQTRLDALGIAYVRLDGSTRDRQAVIDAFQAPEGPPVFLLSLKAGGTGLNLTAADYVFHLDPWWNPAVERQATDRAHRIGQERPVVSCRLIAQGTVEERILELQDAKRDLADAALGGESGMLRSLSATELRSLFEA